MQLIAHWLYISELSGVLTPRKWCTIVTELQQQLNLRSLEQRRLDAKFIMLNKIIHGLVAIPGYTFIL